MIKSSRLIANNLTSSNITALNLGGNGGGAAPFVPCPNMNFVDAFALNSSGAYDGMELTVTNDGVGGGIYFGKSLQNWISSSGKISAEITFDSSTDLSDGNITIGLAQGSTQVLLLQYSPASGIINDVNSATLATVSPTIGQFTMGFTLDQATGTATYSYKLSNGDAATANASLDVAVAYDNSLSTYLLTGSNTPVDGVNVVTINAGQAEYVTNVDGTGYCVYPTAFLKFTGTGYVSIPQAFLRSDFSLEIKDKLGADSTGTKRLTFDSTYSTNITVYDSDHATQADDVTITTFSSVATYTWAGAMSGIDRSTLVTFSLVATSGVYELFINGVSKGTNAVGAKRIYISQFGEASSNSVWQSLSITGSQLNQANRLYGCNDGTGTTVTDYIGADNGTITGTGVEWVFGTSPETAT